MVFFGNYFSNLEQILPNSLPFITQRLPLEYLAYVFLNKDLSMKYVTTHFGCEVFNLGRERSNSVLEVVDALVKKTGIKIPYKVTSRRLGDLLTSYADIKNLKKF